MLLRKEDFLCSTSVFDFCPDAILPDPAVGILKPAVAPAGRGSVTKATREEGKKEATTVIHRSVFRCGEGFEATGFVSSSIG